MHNNLKVVIGVSRILCLLLLGLSLPHCDSGVQNLEDPVSKTSVTRLKNKNKKAKDDRPSLTRKKFLAVMRDKINHFRHCYEMQLQKNPMLAGKIVLEVVIDSKGDVKKVRSKSNSTKNKSLVKCVKSRFKQWNFGEYPKKKNYTFTYPFVFAPK